MRLQRLCVRLECCADTAYAVNVCCGSLCMGTCIKANILIIYIVYCSVVHAVQSKKKVGPR